MEPLEKLEIILQGMINELKKEIERAKNVGASPSYPYLNGVEHELLGVKMALIAVQDMKNKGFSTSDEVIEKRYKSKMNTLCGGRTLYNSTEESRE